MFIVWQGNFLSMPVGRSPHLLSRRPGVCLLKELCTLETYEKVISNYYARARAFLWYSWGLSQPTKCSPASHATTGTGYPKQEFGHHSRIRSWDERNRAGSAFYGSRPALYRSWTTHHPSRSSQHPFATTHHRHHSLRNN